MTSQVKDQIEIQRYESHSKLNLWAEVAGYTGSFLLIIALTIAFSLNWNNLSSFQKSAIFSLLGISLFVLGLIVSNGADIRKRASSFLYSLSAVLAGLAIYVTLYDDSAILQGFILGTVVALLGYTVAKTLLGHLTLYIGVIGSLASVGYSFIDSQNLRTYFQVGLVIAFAIYWMLLAAIEAVNMALGLILGGATLYLVSQYVFFTKYEILSYVIGLAIPLITVWLYLVTRSWVLPILAIVAAPTTVLEFAIHTLNSSVTAILLLVIFGATVAAIGIAASSKSKV